MAEFIVIAFLIVMIPVMAWVEHRQNIRKNSLPVERVRRMQ